MPSDLNRISSGSLGTLARRSDYGLTPTTVRSGSQGLSTVASVPPSVTLPTSSPSGNTVSGGGPPVGTGAPVLPQRTLPDPNGPQTRSFGSTVAKTFKQFVSAFKRSGKTVDLPELDASQIAKASRKATSEAAFKANLPKYTADIASAATEKKAWTAKINLDGAKISTSLAEGNFGKVSRLEQQDPTSPPLAIKTVKGGNENGIGASLTYKEQEELDEQQGKLETEAMNHAKAGDHPNIVKCFGIAQVKDSSGVSKTGLVMEFIEGGKMTDALAKLQKLRDGDRAAMNEAGLTKALSQREYIGTIQYMTAQVAQGLYHLDLKGVVHNDTRADNVMVNGKTGEVKIADFGNAFDRGHIPKGTPVPFGTGTVSPDVMRLDESDESAYMTGKHDVFGLGATVYQTIEGDKYRYGAEQPQRKSDGKFPEIFAKAQMSNLATHVEMAKQGTASDPIQFDPVPGSEGKQVGKVSNSGSHYMQFVNAMMHTSDTERLSGAEALAHPFLSDRLLDDDSAKKILQRCMGTPMSFPTHTSNPTDYGNAPVETSTPASNSDSNEYIHV